MDWPTVYVIYGIGFGIVFLITVLLALSVMEDKDFAKDLYLTGFIVAVLWPLVVAVLLLLGACLLLLYLFSLICRVIFR